jgi:RNA polymerase sigma-70 factor (ECF subfamily)
MQASVSDAAEEEARVAASQRGDTLAFNRLVLKWERPIYNLTLRLLQDEDEAAEATQEIFLLAFKYIHQFRREARFSTWLYRIAANHCTSRLRQRPVATHVSLDDQDEEASLGRSLPVQESPEKEYLREENRRRVTRALAQLSPEQRIVVELKFLQDLKFEEIALIVQAPLSTVKTRLYSGLENLKVRLGRTSPRN